MLFFVDMQSEVFLHSGMRAQLLITDGTVEEKFYMLAKNFKLAFNSCAKNPVSLDSFSRFYECSK